MKDDDSLYFSFDDQDEGEEEEDLAQAEEGQNKSFLYGIIALVALAFLVICGVIAFIFLRPQLGGLLGGQQAQVSPNELTNQANMATFALTQTAAFEAQIAPTEALDIVTPTPQTSPTPTSGVDVTVIGTEAPEGTAEGTQEAEGTPGEGTQVAEITPGATEETPGATSAETPTPRVSGLVTPTSIMPTSSIIEVTPLGGSGPTPTRLVSGVGGTAVAGGTPVATGVGGPIQPTIQATLPTTGFTGGAGLLGAGFLAMVLVAVVVIVRRIRLH